MRSHTLYDFLIPEASAPFSLGHIEPLIFRQKIPSAKASLFRIPNVSGHNVALDVLGGGGGIYSGILASQNLRTMTTNLERLSLMAEFLSAAKPIPSRRPARRYTTLLCILTMFGLSVVAQGVDLSEALPVQRHTLLSQTSFRVESGHLLRNGTFQVLSSTVLSMPLFGDPDEISAVSGRTIVDRVIYEGAENAGVIPRWVRSLATYWVGLEEFVIVSVKGGPNPNPTPVFATQPDSTVYLATGDPLSLFAWSDTDWVSYQWLKNGKPVAGQTFAFFDIDAVSKRDAGRYTLRADVGGATAVSETATVIVQEPITIRRDLSPSVTARSGRNVTLRIMVKGSSPSYAWYHKNIRIETTSSPRLLLRNVTQADAGIYYCVITNHVSFAATADTTLTVTQ